MSFQSQALRLKGTRAPSGKRRMRIQDPHLHAENENVINQKAMDLQGQALRLKGNRAPPGKRRVRFIRDRQRRASAATNLKQTIMRKMAELEIKCGTKMLVAFLSPSNRLKTFAYGPTNFPSYKQDFDALALRIFSDSRVPSAGDLQHSSRDELRSIYRSMIQSIHDGRIPNSGDPSTRPDWMPEYLWMPVDKMDPEQLRQAIGYAASVRAAQTQSQPEIPMPNPNPHLKKRPSSRVQESFAQPPPLPAMVKSEPVLEPHPPAVPLPESPVRPANPGTRARPSNVPSPSIPPQGIIDTTPDKKPGLQPPAKLVPGNLPPLTIQMPRPSSLSEPWVAEALRKRLQQKGKAPHSNPATTLARRSSNSSGSIDLKHESKKRGFSKPEPLSVPKSQLTIKKESIKYGAVNIQDIAFATSAEAREGADLQKMLANSPGGLPSWALIKTPDGPSSLLDGASGLSKGDGKKSRSPLGIEINLPVKFSPAEGLGSRGKKIFNLYSPDFQISPVQFVGRKMSAKSSKQKSPDVIGLQLGCPLDSLGGKKKLMPSPGGDASAAELWSAFAEQCKKKVEKSTPRMREYPMFIQYLSISRETPTEKCRRIRSQSC